MRLAAAGKWNRNLLVPANDMNSRPAEIVLDDSYLDTRAKLLEVAAVLDRVDRSAAVSGGMPSESEQSRSKLIAAIQLLLDESPNRAEKIQHLFSRDYDPNWQTEMGITATTDRKETVASREQA